MQRLAIDDLDEPPFARRRLMRGRVHIYRELKLLRPRTLHVCKASHHVLAATMHVRR